MRILLDAGAIVEAREAGKLLREEGVFFDVVYTSSLRRAIRTACLVLSTLNQAWVPMHKRPALNEQHSGALTGRNKRQLAQEMGVETVMRWRRSYDCAPPAQPRNATLYRRIDDLRYNPVGLPRTPVPKTESFATCVERVAREWRVTIRPALERGENVLVVSHGNTMRALVMLIDSIARDDVRLVDLPTAAPLVYDFKWDSPASSASSTTAVDPDVAECEMEPTVLEMSSDAADARVEALPTACCASEDAPKTTPTDAHDMGSDALWQPAATVTLCPLTAHGFWGDGAGAIVRHGRFLTDAERVRTAQEAMRAQVLKIPLCVSLCLSLSLSVSLCLNVRCLIAPDDLPTNCLAHHLAGAQGHLRLDVRCGFHHRACGRCDRVLGPTHPGALMAADGR
jgi:2,3-bisphosphoglycerate-dependent phosphoglycerate mutase